MSWSVAVAPGCVPFSSLVVPVLTLLLGGADVKLLGGTGLFCSLAPGPGSSGPVMLGCRGDQLPCPLFPKHSEQTPGDTSEEEPF